MAIDSRNHQDSGDPLQKGDAYQKKNFNQMWLMIFGFAVLIVLGLLLVSHLYFAKPDGQNKVRSSPSALLPVSTVLSL